MSKIPASSKHIWDIVVNEAEVFKNDQEHQIRPNHLDPPEPEYFSINEDGYNDPKEVDNPLNNRPVPFERAKQYCFSEFLKSNPQYTDRGVRVRNGGFHPGIILPRVDNVVQNSHYKETYTAKVIEERELESKLNFLRERMTQLVHQDPPRLDPPKSDFDHDFLHSALFYGHKGHHPTDYRMKARKTNRELSNEPFVTDIDPVIRARLRQIKDIRVAQKSDDDLLARKILSQSDPRRVLPAAHTSMLLHRHTSKDADGCPRCDVAQGKSVRTGHFSDMVRYHRDKPQRYETYH